MRETILFGPGGQPLGGPDPASEAAGVDPYLPRAIELSKDKGVQSICYALRTGFRLQAFAAQLLHSYGGGEDDDVTEGAKRLLIRQTLAEQVDEQGKPLGFGLANLQEELRRHAIVLIGHVLQEQEKESRAKKRQLVRLDRLIRDQPVYFRAGRMFAGSVPGFADVVPSELPRGRTIVRIVVPSEDDGSVGLLLRQALLEDDVRTVLLSSIGGEDGASIERQERSSVLAAEHWAGVLSKAAHPFRKHLQFVDALLIDRPLLGLSPKDHVGLTSRLTRFMRQVLEPAGAVLFVIGPRDEDADNSLAEEVQAKGWTYVWLPAEVRNCSDGDEEESVLHIDGIPVSAVVPRTQDPSYVPVRLPDDLPEDDAAEAPTTHPLEVSAD